MATIRARGHLIAGVDQNTYHFEYLNPLDGQIEGFDIDMIRAVAQAIFGNPDAVQYKAITDDERIPDIQKWQRRHRRPHDDDHLRPPAAGRLLQRLLRRAPAGARARRLERDGVATLAGQRVCATEGSDSIEHIEAYPTHPKVVQVPYRTDCLVMLQQDRVAAISSDDSILEGLQAQDPFTKIVGPDLTNEPYGLAISKGHPDFVRFVNAVLAQERAGGWEASYRRWVGPQDACPRAVRRIRPPPRAGQHPRSAGARILAPRPRPRSGPRPGPHHSPGPAHPTYRIQRLSEHSVTPVTQCPGWARGGIDHRKGMNDQPRRRFVCTLGPATSSQEQITALIGAGLRRRPAQHEPR